MYGMHGFASCKVCDMFDIANCMLSAVSCMAVLFQDCGLQLTDEPDKRCYPLGERLLCHTCHIACLSSQYPDQTFYVDPTTRNIQNAARDPRHSLSLPATAPSSYTAVSMHNFGGPPVMMSGSGGGPSNGDVSGSGGMGFSRPKQHTHLGSNSNQHGHFGSSSHAHPGSHYGNGGVGVQNGSYPPSPAPPPYSSQHMSPTGGGMGGNGYSPGPPPPRPSSAKPATYTITDLWKRLVVCHHWSTEVLFLVLTPCLKMFLSSDTLFVCVCFGLAFLWSSNEIFRSTLWCNHNSWTGCF